MSFLLLIACAGSGVDTAGGSDPAVSSFLQDYAVLQCGRLAECDAHFDDHFSSVEECHVFMDETFAQYQECDLVGDGDACLVELESAGCEAVLTNDLPACGVEIWECPA